MKSITAIVIFACSIIIPNIASAITGTDFLEKCSGTLTPLSSSGPYTHNEVADIMLDKGYCIGYVEGFTSAMNTYEASGRTSRPIACIPSNTKTRQSIMVLLKYLENNPRNLHNEVSDLAKEAYSDAFPCK